MPVYVNIDGSSKQLTSLYNNINGVSKTISTMYANINAVQKEIFNNITLSSASSLADGDIFYMDDPQMNKAEYIVVMPSFTEYYYNSTAVSATGLIGAVRTHVLNNPITNSATFKSKFTSLTTSESYNSVASYVNTGIQESNSSWYDWASSLSPQTAVYDSYISYSETYNDEGGYVNGYTSNGWTTSNTASYSGIHCMPYTTDVIWRTSTFGSGGTGYAFSSSNLKSFNTVATKDNGTAVSEFTGVFDLSLFSDSEYDYSVPKLNMIYRNASNATGYYSINTSSLSIYIRPLVFFNGNSLTVYVKS